MIIAKFKRDQILEISRIKETGHYASNIIINDEICHFWCKCIPEGVIGFWTNPKFPNRSFAIDMMRLMFTLRNRKMLDTDEYFKYDLESTSEKRMKDDIRKMGAEPLFPNVLW